MPGRVRVLQALALFSQARAVLVSLGALGRAEGIPRGMAKAAKRSIEGAAAFFGLSEDHKLDSDASVEFRCDNVFLCAAFGELSSS